MGSEKQLRDVIVFDALTGQTHIEQQEVDFAIDVLPPEPNNELTPEQEEMKILKRRLDEAENTVVFLLDMNLMGGM